MTGVRRPACAGILRAVLAIGLGTASGSAFALDCRNAYSTIDLNECAQVEQKAMEDKLNATYAHTMQALGSADAAALKQKVIVAQRAWIKFREADCAAEEARWAGGTAAAQMFLGCMRQRAEQRIKDLESLAQRGG
ncbi:lysozyme inhibitor LprI family protein [Massilia sp. 9096]|uniref:lysozyme inhibitor LprI family protein n=1 Tax=Massilia sp. 9096 TaxID=1500894 RepID=UPI0009DD19FA|nr:lysozyme inhibitor LprI family protein [Massilia sp. 9096]